MMSEKLVEFSTLGENIKQNMEELTKEYISIAEKIEKFLIELYGNEKQLEFPVDIEWVAHKLGITVEKELLNKNDERQFNRVLGSVVTRNGETVITVDKEVSDKTRNYAMAHAVGRYLLSGGASIFESTYAIPLIPQNIDEIIADVVALFLLMPVELFQKEFKIYLESKAGRPLDVDEWLDYLGNKCKLSRFNLSIGYQQLKQVLSYQRQTKFENCNYDFRALEEEQYNIIYA